MNNHLTPLEREMINKFSEGSPLSDEEILLRNADFIKQVIGTSTQASKTPSVLSQAVQTLQLGIQQFAFAVKDLLESTSGPQLTGQFQTATARGSSGPHGAKQEPQWHQARYRGKDCVGILTLREDKSGTARFYFSMEDNDGNPVLPIYLTVRDAEGNLLKERDEIRIKDAYVAEVPLGNYKILLETADQTKQVQMGIQI